MKTIWKAACVAVVMVVGIGCDAGIAGQAARAARESPAVKAADVRLNQAWKALIEKSSAEEARLLRSMQRDWLKSVPQNEEEPDVLAAYYDDRTAYLEALTARKNIETLRREEAVFGRYGERIRSCWFEKGNQKCGGMVDSAVFLLPTSKPGEARLIIDTVFFNGHSCSLNEVGRFDLTKGVLTVELETMDGTRYMQEVVVDQTGMKIDRPVESVGTPGYCGARGSIFDNYPRWRTSASK